MRENAQHMQERKRPSGSRAANAVVSVVLVIFVLVHVILGTLLWYGLIGGTLAVVAWVGVGLVALHIILSIVTTASMLRDKERVPSKEKKKHQLLKWITGLLALACVVLHVTIFDLSGYANYTRGALIALALLILLGVHTYMGTKSLTHDLQLSPEVRKPFRIGVIFFTAFLVTLFGLVSI